MGDADRRARTLPHNDAAEASILGGILLRNDVLSMLVSLERDDFYNPRHKVVFDAMRELEARSQPIDVVTLENEIQRQGKLDAIGGVAFLGELALLVPTASNVETYAQLVVDYRVRRDVIRELVEVTENGYDSDKGGEALIHDANMALMKIRTGQETPVTTMGDLALEEARLVVTDCEARARGELVYPGVPTGFVSIDERCGGHPIGVMTLYIARPATGKAQPHDEPVLTPTGWRRIGDLAPGDLVIGASGEPTMVTGVFERGVQPCYRVTAHDGGWTICAGDHLWTTRYQGTSVGDRTTDEIAATVRGPQGPQHRIPVVGRPRRFERAIVSVEPVGAIACRCISVTAEDGLYVTRGHLVTHNTTFAMSVCQSAKRIADMDSLLCSYEDAGGSFGQRTLAQETGIPTERLRARKLSPQELDAVRWWMAERQAATAARRSEYFLDCSGLEVEQLVRRVRRENMRRMSLGKKPLRQIVVDYIQKMPIPSWARSRDEGVGHISRVLSTFAATDKLAVVVMCQLNREIEKRDDHRPRLSDIRDTGSLEQDGKMIFGIYYPYGYDPKNHKASDVYLLLLKNAQGEALLEEPLFWARQEHGIYNSALDYQQARSMRGM